MHKQYKFEKLLFNIIIVFFLTSCSMKPIKVSYGAKNLEQKFTLLADQFSNKNDTISLLGEALIKEYPDDNIWIYSETETINNFFGKGKILRNNFLILEFNSKGVLISKMLMNEKNFNNLEFEKITTKSFSVNNSISKKFLASMRKRFQNKTNSQTSQ